MKGLRQFLKFDTEAFFNGKTLVAVGVKPYYEYVNGEKTEKILGTKIEAVVGVDNTKYSGQDITNVFEKLAIKIPGNNNFQISNMAKFKVKKFSKSTVYGQYQNNLSLETSAENIEVL